MAGAVCKKCGDEPFKKWGLDNRLFMLCEACSKQAVQLVNDFVAIGHLEIPGKEYLSGGK